MKKTVSVIGIVGIPARYGGFETLVENLVCSNKIEYLVYCQSSAYKEKKHNYRSSKLKYIPIKANGWQSIFYDTVSIIHSLVTTRNDLLILGVSGCLIIPLIKLFCKRNVVVNIDGIEWQRNKWNNFASAFLKFSELVAVNFADIVICDNKAITDYVKKRYKKNTVTIAYGGDHARLDAISDAIENYHLALCRIEQENNVEMILEAYSNTSIKLKFIGNWNSSKFGRQLKNRYRNFENIEIIDSIYDQLSLFNYRSKAKVYIHGHSAGGTNPSLVEMMHLNSHIICFDCDFNRETTENKASYFSNKDQLIDLISEKVKSNDINMKEIASKRYTWRIIRSSYENLF